MNYKRIGGALAGLLLVAALSAGVYALRERYDIRPLGSAPSFHVRPSEKLLTYSIWRTAPLEVAKVFGRSPGCTDAPAEMIQKVANTSVELNLDPALAAGTIAVESGCNQWAVSKSGAIGMMQVMPRIWRDQFDFTGRVNLFNEEDNIRTGSIILSQLVKQYGTSEGLRRYNGVGVGCDTCDATYVTRIIALAGR